MKSTELIKGKWYINYSQQIIKFKVFEKDITYCSAFINFKRDKLYEGVYSTSNAIREAIIDDFSDEFKYLFKEILTDPNYEIY